MPVTINGSSGLTANDGSVFTDSSGNVGIGTGSPAAPLQIGDATQATREVRTSTLGGTAQGGFLRGYRAGSPSFYVGDDAPISGGSGGGLTMYAYGANAVMFYTNGVERGRFDSSGNFQFNSGYGSVATAYGCRAWVNFNGTGTVAIRASGNVSSITDNGTGDYTVNFTTAMPDANYCSNLTVSGNSGSYNSPMILESVAPTSSAIRFINMFDSNYSGFPEARDPAYCNVAIFR